MGQLPRDAVSQLLVRTEVGFLRNKTKGVRNFVFIFFGYEFQRDGRRRRNASIVLTVLLL
jgi:hypothetical protein